MPTLLSTASTKHPAIPATRRFVSRLPRKITSPPTTPSAHISWTAAEPTPLAILDALYEEFRDPNYAAVPLLRRMAHLPPHTMRSMSLPLGQRIVSTTGRHQFYTVRIVDGTAIPAFKASGDITSMSLADGYIEIPAQTDVVEAGEVVDVRLF